ncbi:RHS repeat-associated core domain-containing protein [Kitasatospora sp. NPDC059571]|uniref:RHS repeat-associated core domain-containing protein n=1 Tax=Kitasatospora sp. NPDC059571 TaxID=3346871 RepID=UPI0036904353
MSNRIVKALEHGAQKLGKTLAEDAGKAVHKLYKQAGDNLTKVAKNTRDIDAIHAKDLEKILHGEGDKGLPHPRSANGGGRGRGSHPRGRGREQVADPRTEGRPLDSRCSGGEPVDMATGRMYIDQTDVALAGSLYLLFNRSFDSGYRAGRWMGPRWVCTFDERLEIDAQGVVHLGADRVSQTYPHPETPDEPVHASAGARCELTLTSRGDYALTDPSSGLTREFSLQPDGAEALLTRLRDRSGRYVDFDYDPDGTPVSMTHSGGYRIMVTVDGDRITALRLAGAGEGGREQLLTRYGYADGHLTSVYNSSGKPLRFSNDSQGRVVAWTDRNGTRYRYVYDQFDRVVEEGAEDGSLRFGFEYGDPDPVTGIRIHSETDALGHCTRYHVNEHAQVVAQSDPLGNTTLFERDAYDRLLLRTDPLGRTTAFEYDGAGDLVAVVRPDGERSTTAYLGTSSLPTVITRPGGRTWRQAYDEEGRLLSITDPAGVTTRYGYDELGHIASVTDPLGHSTVIRCNAAGLPVEVTDRTGEVSLYERDAFGRVTAVTDQLGGITRLVWSSEGRLLQLTAPDGSGEIWSYDAEGNVLAHTDSAGRTTSFEYTPFETVAARTDPDGARLTFTYDAAMQLVAVTNALGQSWDYTYDGAGRLIRESDFHGRPVSYELDAAGQVVSRTTPLGSRIDFVHDALGNVVSKNVDGAATTYGYDPAGNLLRATGPDVDLLRTVDPLGNLLTESVNGRTLTHIRDGLGRRIGRTTPSGHHSSWTYDEADRRTSLTTPAGSLTFAYDAAGRESVRTVGEHLTLDNSWDSEHRLTRQVLRAGPEVLQHRDFAYRTDGILAGVDDLLNGQRTFEHDAAGRVTAVHAADWTETYAYDPAGNLTEAEWPATGGTRAALGTRTYEGTELASAGRVRYEHDRAGRVTLRQITRLSRKPDTWRYTWDAEDRLTQVTTPDGTRWRYLYDPLGRRIAKLRLGADGTSVTERIDFTWDGATLVEQSTQAPFLPGPHTLSWEYRDLHPLCQTESITRPGAADGTREQIDRRFFAIVTDLVGTPTELVDPVSGTIAWRATPTLWGNTTWPADSTTYTPLRFPGQYFDPETRLHYNLNRYYDPETARYTSPDPLGLSPAPNPDTYVHNPHTWSDPFGLSPNPPNPLKKQLMDIGKKRAEKAAAGLGEGETPPGAYSVGRDRTTGKLYYGDSGPEHGHAKAVQDALPKESQREDGRPPGVCGEPRMFTNAIKDGADPKNIDLVTVNTKGKKFKMCDNCKSWVPGFGGEVLTD